MLYEPDLARIHVDGYGFHWEGAAPAVLQWLRDAGIFAGTVVDLGCGGGHWLARLAEAGYETVGVDVSPAMLRLARSRAPAAMPRRARRSSRRTGCASSPRVSRPSASANNTYTFAHNTNGDNTSVTDPTSKVTTMAYDSLGTPEKAEPFRLVADSAR